MAPRWKYLLFAITAGEKERISRPPRGVICDFSVCARYGRTPHQQCAERIRFIALYSRRQNRFKAVLAGPAAAATAAAPAAAWTQLREEKRRCFLLRAGSAQRSHDHPEPGGPAADSSVCSFICCLFFQRLWLFWKGSMRKQTRRNRRDRKDNRRWIESATEVKVNVTCQKSKLTCKLKRIHS